MTVYRKYEPKKDVGAYYERAVEAWNNLSPESREFLEYYAEKLRKAKIRNLGELGIIELLTAIAEWCHKNNYWRSNVK